MQCLPWTDLLSVLYVFLSSLSSPWYLHVPSTLVFPILPPIYLWRPSLSLIYVSQTITLLHSSLCTAIPSTCSFYLLFNCFLLSRRTYTSPAAWDSFVLICPAHYTILETYNLTHTTSPLLSLLQSPMVALPLSHILPILSFAPFPFLRWSSPRRGLKTHRRPAATSRVLSLLCYLCPPANIT